MMTGAMSNQRTGSKDSAVETNRLVVVADGNTGRGQRLIDTCTTAGYPCKLAPHGAAALEIALAARPAVVVAQLDLPLVDAIKLAEILRANPRTRAARFLFLGPGETLGSRGAVGDRLLPSDTRPEETLANIEDLFERQERIDLLDAANDRGGIARGELAELPLPDLLQTLLLQRRSGRVELQGAGESEAEQVGSLVIRDGEVIQAEIGTVDGEKALFRLLTWRQGRFSFEPGSSGEAPMILAPTRRLLMEGLRQIAEWDRLAPQLPPLDSPVKLTVKSSELPNIIHPLTQEVLLLLELYTTVRDVVDHCAFPDYQVLRTLHTLEERSIVRLSRVPPPVTESRPASDRFFNEAQQRRLREWLHDGSGRDVPMDAKLLVVASHPEAIPDFTRLLEQVPGVELSDAAGPGDGLGDQISTIGRVAVDDQLGIELIHLPTRPSFTPFWPVAGSGALGTLFLLSGPVGEAVRRVEAVAAALSRLPRARIFHVVLLAKDDRISPEELRENLSLIDEASLFLLPVESGKDPSMLLRGLFTRLMP